MKKKNLCLSLFILLTGCQQQKEPEIQTLTHYVPPFFVDNEVVFPLNTTICLYLYDEAQFHEITPVFDELITSLHKEADRYHTYEGINNLKVVNDAYQTNEEVFVSDALFELLTYAMEMTKLTEGMFNMAMGSLIDVYSDLYTQDVHPDPDEAKIMDALTCIPSYEEIDQIIILDEEKKSVRFQPLQGAKGDVIISLGAIAKGYVIQKAYEFLQSKNYPALINAGTSTLAINGKNPLPGRESWNIGLNLPMLIADPSDPFSCVISLEGSYGISTSADNEQYYLKEEQENQILRHHILNPFSGYSSSYHRSITVFSETADLGVLDALTTALFNIENEEEVLRIVQKVSEYYQTEVTFMLLNPYEQSMEEFEMIIESQFQEKIAGNLSSKIKRTKEITAQEL